MTATTFTKPCGRVGCAVSVTVPKPYLLKRRKYCSMSCATQDRMSKGWVPHRFLTAEDRARGGVKGGLVTGGLRHRQTLANAVRQCERLLPAVFHDELSAHQLARIRVLMGRSFILGQMRERQRLDRNRRYHEQKAGVA